MKITSGKIPLERIPRELLNYQALGRIGLHLKKMEGNFKRPLAQIFYRKLVMVRVFNSLFRVLCLY